MRDKQKEESVKSGSIRLQYLSKLKKENKSSRFNEDLKSEYSHVLQLSSQTKRQNYLNHVALSQRDNNSMAPSLKSR